MKLESEEESEEEEGQLINSRFPTENKGTIMFRRAHFNTVHQRYYLQLHTGDGPKSL